MDREIFQKVFVKTHVHPYFLVDQRINILPSKREISRKDEIMARWKNKKKKLNAVRVRAKVANFFQIRKFQWKFPDKPGSRIGALSFRRSTSS